MLIYQITNHINGKIYIGQTIKNLNDRIYQYKIEIKKVENKHLKGRSIILAILKYGINNFEWQIIEDNILDEGYLDQREMYWIDILNARDKKIGYNISLGGNSTNRGIKLEGENLEKARAAALLASQKSAELSRGKPLEGKKLIASLKSIKKAQKKSAENRKNKPLSKEHKNNISKGLTNNFKVIAASKKPRFRNRIKLTSEQIKEIYEDNIRSQKQMALDYQVSTATISRIKNNKRYFKSECDIGPNSAYPFMEKLFNSNYLSN